jgi:acetyltransferase-like isoleucine patch superfamily enzyme
MKRKIQRLLFHSLKFLIGLLAYLDSRIYMKLYTLLLRSTGLRIIGTPRFIAKSVMFDDFDRIEIGDHLVVSINTCFLTHDYSYTTALRATGETAAADIGILRNITIGNNVFIGMNSIILPGCKIGHNVIIGAGSVVRGTIEDFSVYAGNPAQRIGDIRDYAEKTKSRGNQDFRYDKR